MHGVWWWTGNDLWNWQLRENWTDYSSADRHHCAYLRAVRHLSDRPSLRLHWCCSLRRRKCNHFSLSPDQGGWWRQQYGLCTKPQLVHDRMWEGALNVCDYRYEYLWNRSRGRRVQRAVRCQSLLVRGWQICGRHVTPQIPEQKENPRWWRKLRHNLVFTLHDQRSRLGQQIGDIGLIQDNLRIGDIPCVQGSSHPTTQRNGSGFPWWKAI